MVHALLGPPLIITELSNNLGISQGIFTDVADIVSDSNLYYEKIGPHLLYITGWIEIKPGTYNASYQIFKMDEYKAKINTMLHAIDVTKLTSPVYPIYVANDTGIASLKLNQTLTSSLNLQITSFIVVWLFLGINITRNIKDNISLVYTINEKLQIVLWAVKFTYE